MRAKALKIAILLGLGLFFINACLSTKPAPVKRTQASQGDFVNLRGDFLNLKGDLSGENSKNLPVLVNFNDESRLARLKSNFSKPNLHIRIFGDSHMAADFFSSRLRSHINTNATGFVYALQPKYHQVVGISYKSQNFELLNSKSKDLNANFAMGGIIAKALKKDAFIVLDNASMQKATLISVFKSPHNKDSFVIKDTRGKKFVLKSQNRGKWSFGRIKNASFPLQITALDKNVLLGGFFILNETNNAVIDTLGINGAKSDLWQKWNEEVFLEELNLYKSDIVVLAYGSNDALVGDFDEVRFKDGYKRLIALLYRSNPQTSIVLIAPPTITHKVNGDYEIHADFQRVRNALYDIAKREKLALFDMHAVMENNGGKPAWIEQNLSRGDVHLMPAGYQFMADEFYAGLKKLTRD